MQTYLPPILAAPGEFDLQQIIFVVVFLGIAFLQWLFKVFKEQAEAKERAKQPPPSAEEVEARRRAWQEQTTAYDQEDDEEEERKFKPATPQQQPAPTLSGGLGDILETLRRTMEEQNKPAQAPAPAPPPPPLPAAAQPQASRRVAPAPVPVVLHTPSSSVNQTAANAYAVTLPVSAPIPQHATARTEVRARHSNHPLADFLRTTHGYRRAFILKEVLSPPKALQASPWSTDS